MSTTNPAPANNKPQGASLYPNKPGFKPQQPVNVGGEILLGDQIEYNTGRYTAKLIVRNTGDRPIQVGSHFHFFEVNRYLEFDRQAAFGCHLNIPATTAIRFEPGDQKEVEVVAYAGKRRVIGFNGLVMGYTGSEDEPTYFPARIKALRRARHQGFKSIPESDAEAAMQQHAGRQNQHAQQQAPGQGHGTPQPNAHGQGHDAPQEDAPRQQNNNHQK